MMNNYRVSQISDFQNAAEAQKSEPKLSASGPIFPMNMTWKLLILLSEALEKNGIF